jgi:hypothetical protein
MLNVLRPNQDNVAGPGARLREAWCHIDDKLAMDVNSWEVLHQRGQGEGEGKYA